MKGASVSTAGITDAVHAEHAPGLTLARLPRGARDGLVQQTLGILVADITRPEVGRDGHGGITHPVPHELGKATSDDLPEILNRADSPSQEATEAVTIGGPVHPQHKGLRTQARRVEPRIQAFQILIILVGQEYAGDIGLCDEFCRPLWPIHNLG